MRNFKYVNLTYEQELSFINLKFTDLNNPFASDEDFKKVNKLVDSILEKDESLELNHLRNSVVRLFNENSSVSKDEHGRLEFEYMKKLQIVTSIIDCKISKEKRKRV